MKLAISQEVLAQLGRYRWRRFALSECFSSSLCDISKCHFNNMSIEMLRFIVLTDVKLMATSV